jgi:hypothetical protein
MATSPVKIIFRWVGVLPAALLGFLVSIILSEPLNMLIHHILWSNGHVMPGKTFLMRVLPYDGALAAFLFIQFGTCVAPKHKAIVSFCLLILGGVLAWDFVGAFYSPEKLIDQPPVRIWWPIIGTYLGGISACIWVFATTRINTKKIAVPSS